MFFCSRFCSCVVLLRSRSISVYQQGLSDPSLSRFWLFLLSRYPPLSVNEPSFFFL
uniref:Uncharacterized protein n=1 Tax=Anguilla anguilla TaxID=7936 RepID=A0A0E9QCH6_ANGAN